jgi:hypothetical protein
LAIDTPRTEKPATEAINAFYEPFDAGNRINYNEMNCLLDGNQS